MKKINIRFSVRRMVWILICIISLLVSGVLECISQSLINKLDTQQMAERWSNENDAAQVSCFFSVNAKITPDQLKDFYYNLDDALQEASIVSESENEGARLVTDAYSADGKISITSKQATVDVDAIGIGGDFFLFHPLRLLSGSYFSGNDLMQDYVILNEDAAWKLFGSTDIAGQYVEIKGVAHVVAGVIKQERGKLYEAAGLDGSMVYVSYDSLSKYGTNNGINHYELVMPNPVKEYAYQYVTGAIGVDENEAEIIENSTRYSTWNRIKRIGQFSSRSMNGKAIIYPYWENVARAYEDIVSLLMIFELIFLTLALGIIAVLCILWWRNKTWTVKGVSLWLKDKLERFAERMRLRHKEKKKYRHSKEWQDIKEYEEE